MPEDYDSEVDNALMHGQDPQKRIADLTAAPLTGEEVNSRYFGIPVKEGSRCTNDPLQIALAQHSKTIELVGAVAQERKAHALMQQAQKHLEECATHWNQCQARMWAIKTHVSEEVWESIYYGKERAEA